MEREPNMTPEQQDAQRTNGVLISLALLTGLMVLITSGMPAEIVPIALSQLFGFASLAAIIVATLWRDRIFARHLTHWDKAAVLMGLSILAGLYADPEALEAFLVSTGETATPESSVPLRSTGGA